MGDGAMAEPGFRQRIEPMRIAAGVERITHELRVVAIAKRDAGLRQHHGTELDVESDLQNAGGFQQRPQRC